MSAGSVARFALGVRPVRTTSSARGVGVDARVDADQLGADLARQHRDRAAAGEERREHLRGDLGRVGAHALGGDAVIGRRDDHARA